MLTVTSAGYSINDVAIEGKWSLQNITADKGNYRVKATVEDGKATWSDGTFATREHTIYTEWVSKDNTTNPLTFEAKVWGEASGTNRDGESYDGYATEQEPLVYSVACAVDNGTAIPVKGKKVITVKSTGRVITIDYGTGSCDNSALVSTPGFSGTITVTE